LHKPIQAVLVALTAATQATGAFACGRCRPLVFGAVYTEGFFTTLAVLLLPLVLIAAMAAVIHCAGTIAQAARDVRREAPWR
jgi:hypothetical protein